jgi:HEAT repeat protein
MRVVLFLGVLLLFASFPAEAADSAPKEWKQLIQLKKDLYDCEHPKTQAEAAESADALARQLFGLSQALGVALGKSKDAAVRLRAAEALESMGPSAHIALMWLERALQDEDEAVRAKAADAIGQMGPFAKGSVPDLIKALKDKDNTNHVRFRVAVALSLIGPGAKKALPALEEAAREDDKDLTRSAKCAIKLIKADP